MQITIIKKSRLTLFTLPEKIEGSYWITDFENGKKINLINIEAENNTWKLISNQETFVIDQKEILIPNVLLKENSFYVIKTLIKNEIYYLYCSKTKDDTFKELGIDASSTIRIGSDHSCEISYDISTIPKKACEIKKQNNYYFVSILDEKASVYVNKKRIMSTKRLNYGDIIFIFGLKVILMRRDGRDYLLVNNPNNLIKPSASYSNVIVTKSEFVDNNEELTNDNLYKEENYFYRAPHFYSVLTPYQFKLEMPPSKKDEEKSPAVLTIGPMVTMAMCSAVMLISSLPNVRTDDNGQGMTTIIMSGVMLGSSVFWPFLTMAYDKLQRSSYERNRVRTYTKYLKTLEENINVEMQKQKSSLLENYFTVKDTQDIIKTHNVKLWQRRIFDKDFLTIPVGIGNIPMYLKIEYSEKEFTLSTDRLVDSALELVKKERILTDVPVTFSFYENKSTGIVGDAITTKDFLDRLILQIMANYSYDEVKIVLLTSDENASSWDYLKILPHTWNDDKTFRFFGSTKEEYREIIYYLEKVYKERVSIKEETIKKPHYIIITDAIKSVDTYDVLKNIMLSQDNLGFSIILSVDKISALPNECKIFMNVNREECAIMKSAVNASPERFKIDYTSVDDLYECAKELANIPIKNTTESESSLPDSYQFLEMFQVGKVEQLNIRERWKKSNPMTSLQVPIGIGKSGELVNLDLHEKYHGPHGLIAGTTGSGKSEFIITYILSLAVNYHPYEVQIILIDYKGGSLAGSFTSGKYQLPHIAGTITNLDGNELNRSLASIESEIKRRQAMFNKAREISGESTIDIYKYQKLWREKRLQNMEPIAHLFIISDEFAELKEQQPEFMEKLISAARVGRSLGIHLILATQKPGGVVDPQIWSNTRFRVCLKVQDTNDSKEVLKKDDAAYLKKTGRFYLQVGYDEVYTLGQAAWAGGQYYPSNTFKKDIDTSVNVINNNGLVISSVDSETTNKQESMGEELPNIVEHLCKVAEEDNIKVRKLWLDKIPEKIYIDDLRKKYTYEKKPYYIDPIIGEYDDPFTQSQNILTVPLSKIGNAMVYGIAGSGKEMFIQSLIYSCMTTYSVEEINFYIMDFGAETLRSFEESPYVGGVILSNEKEEFINFIKLISEELDKRKELFASFGGSYQGYISQATEKIPSIVVIINNFEAFVENYEDYVDILNQLSRDGYKYGIHFIITAQNDSSLRFKTKQNFSLNYVLRQNNDTDYSSILGSSAKRKEPYNYKGRGLFKRDGIYEFQTALITEDNVTSYVKEICRRQNENTKVHAKKIPVLPDTIDYQTVKSLIRLDYPIIGINKATLDASYYNFSKNSITCICSYELSDTQQFVNSLMNQIVYLKQYQIILANTSDIIFNDLNSNIREINRNYDELIAQLSNFINNSYDLYTRSNQDENVLKGIPKYMIVIYGVNGFINKISEESKSLLYDLINKNNQLSLVSFVLVDNPDIIRNASYDDWFRSGSDLSYGIWIGNGINEQNLFNISKLGKEDREEITNEFGYIINTSKATKIKVLTSFIAN